MGLEYLMVYCALYSISYRIISAFYSIKSTGAIKSTDLQSDLNPGFTFRMYLYVINDCTSTVCRFLILKKKTNYCILCAHDILFLHLFVSEEYSFFFFFLNLVL